MEKLLLNPSSLMSHFIDTDTMPWKTTDFQGIEMKLLYNDQQGRSAILFRMAPGSVVPLHEHQDLEMTYMLEGTLEDDEGAVGPRGFVWRPGGNRHIARAPNGALFLSIFNRPNRFFDGTPFFTEREREAQAGAKSGSTTRA
jgi:anti-sigma factor ChrR (cupin superfamily)